MNVARNFRMSPYEAWLETGNEPLTPRHRKRLAMACSELWSVSEAFREVTRKRGKHDDPPKQEDVLLVHEVRVLYEEYEFGHVLTDEDVSEAVSAVESESMSLG